MNVVSRMTSGIVTPRASTSWRCTATPPTVKTFLLPVIRSGTPEGLPPSHSCPTSCRMNENPTAVMSGASFGALRNGR